MKFIGHNSTKNVLTNVPRVNTLTFLNSYRAPRTYNRLPSYIRDADVTIGQFKSYLLIYYHEMTDLSEAIRWLKAEYIMKNERGISISSYSDIRSAVRARRQAERKWRSSEQPNHLAEFKK